MEETGDSDTPIIRRFYLFLVLRDKGGPGELMREAVK